MLTDQRLPLLSEAEENQLALQLEAGVLAGHLLESGERPVSATDAELAALAEAGRQAWERLLLSHLRLVHKLASSEARRSGLPADDLFQEGCVALAGALQRFDSRRGRFAGYAAGRIGRHLSEVAAVRLGALGLPVAQAMAMRRARRLASELAQERLREVRPVELADVGGWGQGQAERLLWHRAPAGLGYWDAVPAADGDEGDAERDVFGTQLRREIARLSPELAFVIRLRFGIEAAAPMDLAEIAERLGVSVSTARRRELQGLAVLRQRLSVRGVTREALAS